MKHYYDQIHQFTHRIPLLACVAALAGALIASLPQPVHARRNIKPPPVPSNIQAPAGNKAFLVGHAVGAQNYICLPSGAGFAWTLFTPQATLFNNADKQVTTHFFSPNPFELENGALRPTWQHSQDTSTVWAATPPIASSSDPAFVEPGAIPWLLLRVADAQDGPTGGHKLTATTFIQRLNTSGGVAPSTGCAANSDIGAKALVPYTADYFFYKSTDGE
jgi:hypothetical protein